MVAYNVNQISEEVRDTLSGCKKVFAAVLMGSCSRGEETYFLNKNGERELLSDYEILIIVYDKENIDECNDKLEILSKKLKEKSTSPCFELEWSYKTIREMKQLDKRFIFFEARESASVITGDKASIKLFPVITIKNLNMCELNTIIIHRLYHVLRDFHNKDQHYQQYLIARNTLDIPTAVLPLFGILQSSYEKRNKIFIQSATRYGFSEELVVRLDDYLQMKKDYNAKQYEKYSIEYMREQFVADMKMLYEFQSKKQNGHAFRRNIRLFISAIYRRNIEMLKLSFSWKTKNELLYKKMIQMLEQSKVPKMKLEEIKTEMIRLYNYK